MTGNRYVVVGSADFKTREEAIAKAKHEAESVTKISHKRADLFVAEIVHQVSAEYVPPVLTSVGLDVQDAPAPAVAKDAPPPAAQDQAPPMPVDHENDPASRWRS